MRKNKLACPECGEEFDFHFMKNGWSGKVTCKKCQEELHVENKMFPYFLIAGVIFLFSDYILAFVAQLGLATWMSYVIEFVILLVICIGMITVLRSLFGVSFLYNVHSRNEFRQEKERVDKMKQEMKKKKSQEKK